MKTSGQHHILPILVRILTVIHVVLALNFLIVVPFFGWLNYGHGNWLIAWIPDVISLFLLPLLYFLYWHFWFLIGVPALLGAVYLDRTTANPGMKTLAVLNVVALLLYAVVRIILALRGIHPDIV